MTQAAAHLLLAQLPLAHCSSPVQAAASARNALQVPIPVEALQYEPRQPEYSKSVPLIVDPQAPPALAKRVHLLLAAQVVKFSQMKWPKTQVWPSLIAAAHFIVT